MLDGGIFFKECRNVYWIDISGDMLSISRLNLFLFLFLDQIFDIPPFTKLSVKISTVKSSYAGAILGSHKWNNYLVSTSQFQRTPGPEKPGCQL
jgi:hypothetical protein